MTISMEQMRLIKDLLAPAYDYMEMADFANALDKAIGQMTATAPDSPEQFAWHRCCGAISLLATVRFGFTPWIDYVLANCPGATALMVKRA